MMMMMMMMVDDDYDDDYDDGNYHLNPKSAQLISNSKCTKKHLINCTTSCKIMLLLYQGKN